MLVHSVSSSFFLSYGMVVLFSLKLKIPSGATLKSLQPDVLTWIPSGVLAFKGEDKATAVELDIAVKELFNKWSVFTDTFFGTLCYQICYALGREMLQFCATI